MSFFNAAYFGTPPWDIGRPQGEFVKLADEGRITGDVIDLGCGTGENAIMFAARGNRVIGIDSAPLAIAKARAKAKERGSSAKFVVADAMDLASLEVSFDVATDCGLFHTFSDRERGVFAKSLWRILKPGGKYYMLCFSELEPADWGGPRRVTKDEIVKTFHAGWRVDSITNARFEAFHLGEGGRAWLSCLTRLKRLQSN
jgi:ubiquinone/menaquinone biosynthesis C-methylase UbiE